MVTLWVNETGEPQDAHQKHRRVREELMGAKHEGSSWGRKRPWSNETQWWLFWVLDGKEDLMHNALHKAKIWTNWCLCCVDAVQVPYWNRSPLPLCSNICFITSLNFWDRFHSLKIQWKSLLMCSSTIGFQPFISPTKNRKSYNPFCPYTLEFYLKLKYCAALLQNYWNPLKSNFSTCSYGPLF